jgi:acetyltransferase-like isoleucine patch superfamily enzyme
VYKEVIKVAEIYRMFGVIPEDEIDGIADEQGVITIEGRKLLKRIGVETGSKVSIRKSTIRSLINLYNEWKRPHRRIDSETELIVGKFLGIPEEDIYLEDRLSELRHSFRMGIRIGGGTRIGEHVMLGLGVSIGKFCEVSDQCEICMFSTIHDNVYLGKSAFVGKDSEIESGSKIMPKAVIAPRNLVKEKSSIAEGSVFNQGNKY